MKRVLGVFKDLRDSGQQATIIGQFAIQPGQYQKVTESDDVHIWPNTNPSTTDESKNPNRYTTEHEQNADRILLEKPIISYEEAIPLELVQIIAIWPYLPESVKMGMVAMSEVIAATI